MFVDGQALIICSFTHIGHLFCYHECNMCVSYHRPIHLCLWSAGMRLSAIAAACVMTPTQRWYLSGTATRLTSPLPSVLYVACVCLLFKGGNVFYTCSFLILLVHTG